FREAASTGERVGAEEGRGRPNFAWLQIGVLLHSVPQPPIMDGDLRPPSKPTSAWDFWIVLCRFSVLLSRTGHGRNGSFYLRRCKHSRNEFVNHASGHCHLAHVNPN